MLEENRRASEQVAFRIEPEIERAWTDYVQQGLIPARCHYACAMMYYLWAKPEIRESIQKAFVRFQRGADLDPPADLGLELGVIPADEVELINAYRAAENKAKPKAISDLQKAAKPVVAEK